MALLAWVEVLSHTDALDGALGCMHMKLPHAPPPTTALASAPCNPRPYAVSDATACDAAIDEDTTVKALAW